MMINSVRRARDKGCWSGKVVPVPNVKAALDSGFGMLRYAMGD
jgi:hypothetical protein